MPKDDVESLCNERYQERIDDKQAECHKINACILHLRKEIKQHQKQIIEAEKTCKIIGAGAKDKNSPKTFGEKFGQFFDEFFDMDDNARITQAQNQAREKEILITQKEEMIKNFQKTLNNLNQAIQQDIECWKKDIEHIRALSDNFSKHVSQLTGLANQSMLDHYQAKTHLYSEVKKLSAQQFSFFNHWLRDRNHLAMQEAIARKTIKDLEGSDRIECEEEDDEALYQAAKTRVL